MTLLGTAVCGGSDEVECGRECREHEPGSVKEGYGGEDGGGTGRRRALYVYEARKSGCQRCRVEVRPMRGDTKELSALVLLDERVFGEDAWELKDFSRYFRRHGGGGLVAEVDVRRLTTFCLPSCVPCTRRQRVDNAAPSGRNGGAHSLHQLKETTARGRDCQRGGPCRVSTDGTIMSQGWTQLLMVRPLG